MYACNTSSIDQNYKEHLYCCSANNLSIPPMLHPSLIIYFHVDDTLNRTEQALVH